MYPQQLSKDGNDKQNSLQPILKYASKRNSDVAGTSKNNNNSFFNRDSLDKMTILKEIFLYIIKGQMSTPTFPWVGKLGRDICPHTE